jgi:MFS family permease
VINARPLTFQQAVKKNLKRVLTFWAPLSVLFTGLGALLGFYTLSTYATAIGRPDVMAAAIEAKSALVPWLATVIGMLAVYLLILLSTTVLFGLSVSLFNDIASQQHKLVGVLFLPVFAGIVALMWQVFAGPSLTDGWKLVWTLIWLVLALASLLAFPVFRLAVDTCATLASPGNARSWPLRFWFMLMVALLLVATVICAIFPASLILKAYVGEETPDASHRLMFVSMFAATVALLPVVVFYVSKADLFKRLGLGVLAVIVSGGMVITISPGSPAAIVSAAALVMNVRVPVAANFMLTKTYAVEDFDTTVWGPVDTVRGQPVVNGFPLFSFGDVLLLCPTSLISKGRKDWPEQSAYCVLTQSSAAIRMPKKAPALPAA